jgi:hypothetical protein
MIWDPDEERRRQAEAVDDEPTRPGEPTVRQKIETLLACPGPTYALGGRWWSLADIQQRIRGSSVRSRLQDVMRENRERPMAEREYEEAGAVSQVGKARFNIYRRRSAGVQAALFDVPPSNPFGA